MRALSARPFCPCDDRWVSLRYLSAGLRYTTKGQYQPFFTCLAPDCAGLDSPLRGRAFCGPAGQEPRPQGARPEGLAPADGGSVSPPETPSRCRQVPDLESPGPPRDFGTDRRPDY